MYVCIYNIYIYIPQGSILQYLTIHLQTMPVIAIPQVYERKMGVKFIWGEVKELNGDSWCFRKTLTYGTGRLE